MPPNSAHYGVCLQTQAWSCCPRLLSFTEWVGKTRSQRNKSLTLKRLTSIINWNQAGEHKYWQRGHLSSPVHCVTASELKAAVRPRCSVVFLITFTILMSISQNICVPVVKLCWRTTPGWSIKYLQFIMKPLASSALRMWASLNLCSAAATTCVNVSPEWVTLRRLLTATRGVNAAVNRVVNEQTHLSSLYSLLAKPSS